MPYYDIILLALALAADACVYGFSYGLLLKNQRKRALFELALVVLIFHMGMMLLGYWSGSILSKQVEKWDHWLVLTVFCFLGGQVVYGALKSGEQQTKDDKRKEKLDLRLLLLIGVITSIDVLAVGACSAIDATRNYSLTTIYIIASVIGLVAGIAVTMSFAGSHFLRRVPSRYLELLAGALLIFLGIHYFSQHWDHVWTSL